MCVFVDERPQGQRNKGQETLNVHVQHYERQTGSGRHMHVQDMCSFVSGTHTEENGLSSRPRATAGAPVLL